MVIRHSSQLLEHLSEIEEKIQIIERILEELGLECEKESILRTLLARKIQSSPGQ